MVKERPHVWLDMDPGIDDAWALIVALTQCTVIGVSTVAGNVPLENTYGNAQKILSTVLHRDPEIPVIPGAGSPLLSPLITATDFHGRGGTGDWKGEIARVGPHTERVWSWWNRHQNRLRNSHLIVTGPFSNLATSLLAFPELGQAWASVTCMGGALPGAQVDKAQEFNVYVDPHAADIAFHWTERAFLLGINVAHKAVIPVRDIERLREYGVVGDMLQKMLSFYSQRARGEGGDIDAFPIDDVVAVAAVVRPDLFEWTELPLAVVREGPLRGTVVLSPLDQRRKPIKVAQDVNVEGFREWLWDSMEPYRTHHA